MNTEHSADAAPSIGGAHKRDEAVVAGLLARAELADPFFEGTARSEKQLVRFFIAYLKTHPRQEFRIHVARDSGDTPIGVALWRHQEVGRDSAVFGQLPYLARAASSLGLANLVRALRLQKEFERFRPLEPHWYLAYIAIAEHARHSSIGTALLQHQLDHLDATTQFAYLEARNADQVRFFQRFGFSPGGKIPGLAGRHYTGMFRTPRRRMR
ncbi:GNAT family N-acetyltransferase [Arenivirga flava]|uniref:N-acetyltransferase n=1 Tax=Arenivirga flava TaxID=1930060 RepID=A0AA37UKB1_9MICO|nr:GNAT family N-acetyltransferase [Arenivirga flava]GMA28856.1 N-acetyltransferase [Arenivirga flava]